MSVSAAGLGASTLAPRIAIITDDPGWHGARLRRAFRERGMESRYVSLTECRIDITGGKQPLRMPGFEEHLPDAVFVRGIPGGTLEQVVLRLDILHALREIGVPVYNDAKAVERSVDKAMTSFLLHHAAVPTPPTWVTENIAEARSIVLCETANGHDVVCKPLFGSQGNGLMRLSAGMDVPPPEAVNNVWYLQRFINSPRAVNGRWHDWRVLVIGGTAVAAMSRHGATWINNVAQGAHCESAGLDGQLATLAIDATRAVDMDYAGVDIILDAEDRLQVLEVNSIPAWKGLQSVCEQNIAQMLVDDLIDRRMDRRPRLEAVC